jgi:hypothetical protein
MKYPEVEQYVFDPKKLPEDVYKIKNMISMNSGRLLVMPFPEDYETGTYEPLKVISLTAEVANQKDLVLKGGLVNDTRPKEEKESYERITMVPKTTIERPENATLRLRKGVVVAAPSGIYQNGVFVECKYYPSDWILFQADGVDGIMFFDADKDQKLLLVMEHAVVGSFLSITKTTQNLSGE